MGFLSGKRLTVLGAALIALAAVAAVRVAISDGLRRTAAPAPRESVPGTSSPGERGAVLSADGHVALALSAEKSGDLAAALAHYRAAVAADPRCVDRRSPGFLGEVFEEKLKGWISGMKSGRIAAGPAARDDASFIFRRMYGGCG